MGLGVYGYLRGGRVERAFGGSGDSGVSANVGEPMPFEGPFDEDTGGFGEFVENALAHRLGFRYEGAVVAGGLDPTEVPLRLYR